MEVRGAAEAKEWTDVHSSAVHVDAGGRLRRGPERRPGQPRRRHGAYTARGALEAGPIDEIQLHLVPVLFGNGRKLFDVLPSQTELEVLRVIDDREATHIRYRVLR